MEFHQISDVQYMATVDTGTKIDEGANKATAVVHAAII